MAKTQPEPIRDQKSDHLLTPENCAVVLIDYQPEQYRTVTSSTREEIDLNVIAVCKLARAYDIPVIVSTVGVDMGVNTGTADAVGGISPVSHDRAFDRMIQAGAHPVTAISFGSELMRNWARESSDRFRKVLQWYFPKRFALMKEGRI